MTDSKFLLSLGASIREIRSARNMSQLELANCCQFDKSSMSRIEAGKSNITVLTLKKIAAALEVEVGLLLRTKALITGKSTRKPARRFA